MVSHCGASRPANRTWLQLETVTSSGAALAVRTWSPRRSCCRQRYPCMSVQTDLELLEEGSSDRRHHVSPCVAATGASLRKGTLGLGPWRLGKAEKAFLPRADSIGLLD